MLLQLHEAPAQGSLNSNVTLSSCLWGFSHHRNTEVFYCCRGVFGTRAIVWLQYVTRVYLLLAFLLNWRGKETERSTCPLQQPGLGQAGPMQGSHAGAEAPDSSHGLSAQALRRSGEQSPADKPGVREPVGARG